MNATQHTSASAPAAIVTEAAYAVFCRLRDERAAPVIGQDFAGLKRTEREAFDLASQQPIGVMTVKISPDLSEFQDLIDQVQQCADSWRWVAGIVERGEGRKLEEGERIDAALLSYVRRLEADNTALRLMAAPPAPPAPATPAPGLVARLVGHIEKIDGKASGGLCQFSVGGKHAFLADIRTLCAEAMEAAGVSA